MNEQAIKVVIDVGSSRTRVTIAEVGSNHSYFEVLGSGVSTHAALKAGIVTNIPAVTAAIRQAAAIAEQEAGLKINSALISISGEHILGVNSDGRISIRSRQISHNDVVHAVMRARQIATKSEQTLLHVLEQQFIVDGNQGITNPIGMTAEKLEARVHIISARRAAVENLSQCVRQAGIDIEGIIYAGLASSYAASSADERDLGVCTVDIGAGTADIMLWYRNQPMHAATLAMGGEQVSSELATALRTPRQSAEMLKRSHGALQTKLCNNHRVPLPSTGHLPDRHLSSQDMVAIILACYQSFFSRIGKELHRIGLRQMLDGGMVFTGGGAQIPGLAEEAAEFFNCPVRVFVPPRVEGLDVHLQGDAGMVTTLGLFHLQQIPITDYVWAKEEKVGIIADVRNFIKRYL
ncbi:MAG: cell division protein FtsA [Cardiobacteriaceae bacterium]|nr:cell division protein FtsA [Cardiobacteriaceae bacterium]